MVPVFSVNSSAVWNSLYVDLLSPDISENLFRKKLRDISLPYCLLTVRLLLRWILHVIMTLLLLLQWCSANVSVISPVYTTVFRCKSLMWSTPNQFSSVQWRTSCVVGSDLFHISREITFVIIIVIIVIVVINTNFCCAHYKNNACALQLSSVKAKVKL